MSGARNLSNLKSLYKCCKGFSDAVRILISLDLNNRKLKDSNKWKRHTKTTICNNHKKNSIKMHLKENFHIRKTQPYLLCYSK